MRRSIATWPAIDTTTPLAATSLGVARPASRTASRTASRSGGTHRSCSSSASGSGNVSATGPGPYTGPTGTPRISVVTGRDCSSQRWPSVPTAHSTSCGPPKTCATCLDRATRRRRSVAGSWGPSPRVNSTTLALPSRRYREPSTSPLTRGSGPPSTADTVHRSVRPVTGSTPNSTPPCRGSISGWTRTAIGVPATPARVPRVEDGLHGIDEGGEPRHADDRVELARHRGARRVLQHRRAASDQGLLVATGELEGASQRRVLPPLRRVGIDGRRERRS